MVYWNDKQQQFKVEMLQEQESTETTEACFLIA